MRIVVDSNVWVSAVLTPCGPPSLVRSALGDSRFTLVTSEPLIAEVAEVLARPRLAAKYGITNTDILDLVTFMRERGEVVAVTGSVAICRDPDDDMVIETALLGQADALVARDDDLKGVAELATFLEERGIAVLTVRHFLALLAQPQGT